MSIDYPVPAQTGQLRSLWQVAFGDDDAFLDLFFEKAFFPARCRCVTETGHVAAMLYWFEASCDNQKFAYLYAIATDPSCRNQGLCRALLEDVKALLSGQDYAGLLLVPQTEDLAIMYRRLGFRDCTTVTEFTAPAEEPSLPLRRLNVQEYAAARRELLPKGGLAQEGENLRFLEHLALFFGGSGWVAAVTIEGRKLHCHELLGDPDTAYPLVFTLGCTEGFFRVPGPDKPFAMYCPLTENCAKPDYFGLAFD